MSIIAFDILTRSVMGLIETKKALLYIVMYAYIKTKRNKTKHHVLPGI